MTNLQKIRKQCQMTQKELAEYSGVSLRMIQYYEQGRSDINKAEAMTVWLLSITLGCDMEKLLELE